MMTEKTPCSFPNHKQCKTIWPHQPVQTIYFCIKLNKSKKDYEQRFNIVKENVLWVHHILKIKKYIYKFSKKLN